MPAARILLYVLTLGGIALMARSLLIGPVPLWLALSAAGAYLALTTVGVTRPQLEMFGDIFCRGDTRRRAVVLTFDGGPDPASTPRILASLARRGTPASFFVSGTRAEQHPELLRQIVAAGHELGLGPYAATASYWLKPPAWVRADIERTQSVVERATGQRPRWLRPPAARITPRTFAAASRAGVTLIGWSLPLPRLASPDLIISFVEKRLHPGAVLRLDESGHAPEGPVGPEILPQLLALLDEQGFEVVPLRELLGD